MKKSLLMVIFLSFFLIGCAKEKDNKDEKQLIATSTDYYYEANNKFINDGHVKMKEKDYQGAIDNFTKAIEELPDYAYAYGFRGWAKLEAGDLSGAMVDVNKALEIKNDAHDFYMWRSRIYKAMGNFEAANADNSKSEMLKAKSIDQQLGNI